MTNPDPESISSRCWCGSLWWQDHAHFSVAPVQFGHPRPSPPLTRLLWLLFLASAGVSLFFATSCAGPACKPLERDLANAAGAALVCASQPGATLAGCEQAQLASVPGTAPDALVCAESVLVESSKASHYTAGPNPAYLPPLTDAASPTRSK